jgi:hypothetical protein
MSNKSELQIKLQLKYIDKFNNLDRAESWANHATKMQMIILGDDNKYWVVCMRDGERLLKAGYEVA